MATEYQTRVQGEELVYMLEGKTLTFESDTVTAGSSRVETAGVRLVCGEGQGSGDCCLAIREPSRFQ